MKTEPDIYAENPVVDLDYKIAVMLAYRGGSRTQSRHVWESVWEDSAEHNRREGHEPSTKFNWINFVYRVDPACKPQSPKIAEGNNPQGLTEEQVGVKDGWRLVTKEEIESRAARHAPYTTDAQVRMRCESALWQGHAVEMVALSNMYRTKKPAGFFLPKPKVKVPLTLDVLNYPTLWLRHKDIPNDMLVVAIGHGGLTTVNSAGVDCAEHGHAYLNDFKGLMDDHFEYSSDRVNWKPCYKEVEQ